MGERILFPHAAHIFSSSANKREAFSHLPFLISIRDNNNDSNDEEEDGNFAGAIVNMYEGGYRICLLSAVAK
jgi:hypothetical protein